MSEGHFRMTLLQGTTMHLLTKEEVAVRGHMSLRKLEMLIRQQKGPRRTFVGKRGLITEDDCDAWLLSGREVRDQKDAA
jgi:hypothetical protein